MEDIPCIVVTASVSLVAFLVGESCVNFGDQIVGQLPEWNQEGSF